jgi:hypothetical protein
MSLHSSMSYEAQCRRIDRDQSPTGPRTLRQELNAEYTTQMMKARGYRGSRNPKDITMLKKAEAYMAEIAEQLTLLDACEFGFIAPIIGGDVMLAGAK